MSKFLSKRVVSGVLVGVLALSCLAGCSTNGNNTNKSGETENGSSVVATINGDSVARSEVGTDLLDAEKEVISEYVYNKMLEKFFSDVEVTDTEVNLQIEMMKAQVGEESWPIYLTYYGGGSEETFKTTLKQSLRQEKYISERSEKVEISDEELETKYNESPDKYNIAVLNVVFLSDAEQLNKAIELKDSGKTLQEIATELSLEISEKEHTYFESDSLNWSTPFNACKVGDIVTTDAESGSYVIGEIVELNKGITNTVVRDDLLKSMKYDKAFAEVEAEYVEFLKTQKVEIMGEPYSLYQEEETEDSGEEVDLGENINLDDTDETTGNTENVGD